MAELNPQTSILRSYSNSIFRKFQKSPENLLTPILLAKNCRKISFASDLVLPHIKKKEGKIFENKHESKFLKKKNSFLKDLANLTPEPRLESIFQKAKENIENSKQKTKKEYFLCDKIWIKKTEKIKKDHFQSLLNSRNLLGTKMSLCKISLNSKAVGTRYNLEESCLQEISKIKRMKMLIKIHESQITQIDFRNEPHKIFGSKITRNLRTLRFFVALEILGNIKRDNADFVAICKHN